ncbi:hypothetical protein Pelo_6251 [Pelomyxa schiedti]|nr:hypothetical protein Pelo_6251 [Pelomyxa schiedti]
MGLTSPEICALVSSALSTVGSCIVIVVCIWLRRLHLVYWRSVLCMAIADISLCISIFIAITAKSQGVEDTWVCTFSGILNNIFFLSSQIWTDFLGLTLLWITLRRAVPGIIMELGCHTVAWGLPLTLSLLALVRHDGYCYGTSWCWINIGEYYGMAWGLSMVWEWLAVLFAIIVYCTLGAIAIRHRWKEGTWSTVAPRISIIRRRKENYVIPALRQIVLYPFIMVLLVVAGLVDHDGTWQRSFGSFVMPLQGFLNFVVFVVTAQVDKDKDKLIPAVKSSHGTAVTEMEMVVQTNDS